MSTIQYCCYGKYSDVGHSNDCPTKKQRIPDSVYLPQYDWQERNRKLLEALHLLNQKHEQFLRAELIKLGWTPPPEKEKKI